MRRRCGLGTLTEAEVEQVREAGIFPNDRVALYTKFLELRAAKIKSLSNRPKSGDRVLEIDGLLQDFTSLMDEVGSNLDQYSDRHSDIRKALKTLTETTPRWLQILRALPGESGFDLSRKEGIESGEELADQRLSGCFLSRKSISRRIKMRRGRSGMTIRSRSCDGPGE